MDFSSNIIKKIKKTNEENNEKIKKNIYSFKHNNPQEIVLTKNKRILYIPLSYVIRHYNPERPIIQRSLMEDRVEKLTDILLSYYDEYGYVQDLNNIHIAKYRNKYLLLDGQHRYHAYKKFSEEENIDFNILVTLYEYEEEEKEEYRRIFKELNDIYYTDKDELILEENEEEKKEKLEAYFNENYDSFISKSTQPKFPNVNMDYLLKDIITTFSDKTSPEIIFEFEELNRKIGQDLNSKYEFKDKFDTIIKKKGDNKLFYSYKIYKDKELSEKDKKKRRSISQNMRYQIWIKYFGKDSMNGKCYCCKKDINLMENYECSHVVAQKHGGGENVENLRPCCKGCNNDMKDQNLYDFKNKYFPDN